MVQSKFTKFTFLLKSYYLCITNNEIAQNSKSKPKKFSFLCTFKRIFGSSKYKHHLRFSFYRPLWPFWNQIQSGYISSRVQKGYSRVRKGSEEYGKGTAEYGKGTAGNRKGIIVW
jgi:hypothetical protein